MADLPEAEASEGPAWSRYALDGLLGTVLAEQSSGSDFERLERIAAWDKVIAWAQAHQAREIADYIAATAEDETSAVAEVGLVLRVAARTAAARVDTAVGLNHRLPAVGAALLEGRIGLAAARTVLDETVNLPVDEARAVADTVLRRAAEQTPGQLRVAVRRAVQAADPAAVARRAERAARERGVWLQDEPDGMASLWARLPAPDAVACYEVLDQHARQCGVKCRARHQLKQRPGWALTQSVDGALVWRTPSGHVYTSRPPPLERAGAGGWSYSGEER